MSAKKAREFAMRKQERNKSLFKLNDISNQALNQGATEAQLADAMAAQATEQKAMAAQEVKLARARLSQRAIFSPVSGSKQSRPSRWRRSTPCGWNCCCRRRASGRSGPDRRHTCSLYCQVPRKYPPGCRSSTGWWTRRAMPSGCAWRCPIRGSGGPRSCAAKSLYQLSGADSARLTTSVRHRSGFPAHRSIFRRRARGRHEIPPIGTVRQGTRWHEHGAKRKAD